MPQDWEIAVILQSHGIRMPAVVLPRRSGQDVLAWIRSQTKFDAVSVVVLTSSAEEKDVLTAYTRKANSHLVKPRTAEERDVMAESLRSYWFVHNRFASGPNPAH